MEVLKIKTFLFVLLVLFTFQLFFSPVYAITNEEIFRNDLDTQMYQIFHITQNEKKIDKQRENIHRIIEEDTAELSKIMENKNTENKEEIIEKILYDKFDKLQKSKDNNENNEHKIAFALEMIFSALNDKNLSFSNKNEQISFFLDIITKTDETVGYIYILGLMGNYPNNNEIIKFIENNEKLSLLVGYQYLIGKPNKDYKKAKYYFTKSAEKGNNIAKFALAGLYEYGLGVDKNEENAMYHFKQVYENGENYYSPYHIGEMYFKGKGNIPKDYNLALKWFNISAENGNKYANNRLGDMYKKGLGVDKNYQKAFNLYEKASNNGCSESQYNIAMMYFKGIGLEEDYDQGLSWLQTSANNGYAEAQYALAVILLNSSDYYTDSNTEQKAINLLKSASKQGHEEAKTLLKRFHKYSTGIDVIKTRDFFKNQDDD